MAYAINKIGLVRAKGNLRKFFVLLDFWLYVHGNAPMIKVVIVFDTFVSGCGYCCIHGHVCDRALMR